MYNADNRATGRITYNTAVGYQALRGSDIPANNSGQWNTAIGYQSMLNNTSGSGNTATGSIFNIVKYHWIKQCCLWWNSMATNTVGQKMAFGNWAMELNHTGNYNTACGSHSLRSNTTGYYNTALGYHALYTNTTGSNNTGIGEYAFPTSTESYNWSGFGYDAGSALSISNSIDLEILPLPVFKARSQCHSTAMSVLRIILLPMYPDWISSLSFALLPIT
ncbi:MAG: hypothetical protein IPH45_11715 [Bacteroidales bacterium]|nr:hypothetical protein [Bacteroidales bacterium]